MFLKKILFAAGLFLSAAAYAQTTKLVLNKGQKFEVTTVMKTSSVSNMMGQEMESKLDNTSTETIEVKETRTGETDLVKTVTKMLANIQMMGQDMSYNSENKDNSGPLAETMDKMIGSAKNITIDGNGKTIKEDKDDIDKDQMGMMAGAAASAGIGMFQATFINREMKVNSTWKDSTVNNDDKLKSSITGTYTVVSIDGNIASINFEGSQQMSGTIEQMGMEMGMKGKSKVSTKLKLDILTGLIIESSSTTDGTSEVEAMGMSIPATIKTTTTTTVKSI